MPIIAQCITSGPSWEVQAHQSLASYRWNYTVSDLESNNELNPTPPPPPKKNSQRKKKKGFQVKELREAISASTITSSELIRYWLGGCQTPDQNLQIRDTHISNQQRVTATQQQNNDGRGFFLKNKTKQTRKKKNHSRSVFLLFQWKREKRRKEGPFHYQPTCRLMLHVFTQLSVVMVATCHLICVSPWMKGGLRDMCPPLGECKGA